MKREMRKLNRVKYVYSEEEMQRLLSEGYVVVSMTDPGKTADLTQDQDGKSQAVDSGEKKAKRGAGKNDK